MRAATGATPSVQREKVVLATDSGCTKWVPLADETLASCLLSYYASVLFILYEDTQGTGWSDSGMGFKLNYTLPVLCMLK